MEYWHDKFPIVRDMIGVLYDYRGAGGCCHIVTDDGNIYDEDLDFVIEYAQKEENKDSIDAELSIAICKILKTMTFFQRAVLFDSMNYDGDYHDKESFDAFYDNREENLREVFRMYDWDKRLSSKENINIKHFRYDMISAYYDGVDEHPQTKMEKLGFHWIKSEAVPIADCWWFRCDKYPDEIPTYIKIMDNNFKFSEERNK